MDFCSACGSKRVRVADLYCRACGSAFADATGMRGVTPVVTDEDRPTVAGSAGAGWLRTNPVGVTSVCVLLASGVLALVGALLPWVDAPFGISKTGIEGDGILTAIAGLIIMALATALLFRGDGWRWAWALSTASLILGAFVLIVALYDIDNTNRLIANSRVPAKLASGIYLTAIAGGVAMAGGLLGYFSGPSQRSGPAPAAPE